MLRQTTLIESRGVRPSYLPDVNVLLALSDRDHVHYMSATRWLAGASGAQFLVCAVTEAGFVRIASNPLVGKRSIKGAIELLEEIRRLPNCVCLVIDTSLLELIDPLRSRMHGYRQVTDAMLLGLAIRNDAVLVTLDQKIQALVGERFKANLLTLV